MKKIILSLVILFSFQAKSQINVSESFETGDGSTLPGGFTSTNSSGANSYAPFGTYAGNACDGNQEVARRLSVAGNSWLLTYSSAASNGNALSYSFSYLAKPSTPSTSIMCNFFPQYSVDNGSTWTNLYNLGINLTTGVSQPCTSVSGTIPAGVIPAGASFKFRFNSQSYSSGDFWMGFDNLILSQSALSTDDFNSGKMELKVFPNPFKDIVSINNIEEIESIKITDITGKIVRIYPTARQNLDLQELNAGMYFINMKMKNGTSKSIKSIKQ